MDEKKIVEKIMIIAKELMDKKRKIALKKGYKYDISSEYISGRGGVKNLKIVVFIKQLEDVELNGADPFDQRVYDLIKTIQFTHRVLLNATKNWCEKSPYKVTDDDVQINKNDLTGETEVTIGLGSYNQITLEDIERKVTKDLRVLLK